MHYPQWKLHFKTVIAAVTYGIAVWGTCSQALTSQLERVHARAAKLIHKLPKNISDEEALLNVDWDRLDYIYKRRMLTIMHKLCHDDCPEDFKQLFAVAAWQGGQGAMPPLNGSASKEEGAPELLVCIIWLRTSILILRGQNCQ